MSNTGRPGLPWPVWSLGLISALSWLGLLTIYYCAYPLSAVLSLGVWLVLIGGWGWALSVAAAFITAAAWRKAYWIATAGLVVAVTAAVLAWQVNWSNLYVDSQFRLHHAEFVALAADFNAAPRDDVTLPADMRYLSIDGHAHRRGAALYLPVWQDWRAETGVGIAYFPGDTAVGANIATASGDMGSPARYLGDGWWWVS